MKNTKVMPSFADWTVGKAKHFGGYFPMLPLWILTVKTHQRVHAAQRGSLVLLIIKWCKKPSPVHQKCDKVQYRWPKCAKRLCDSIKSVLEKCTVNFHIQGRCSSSKAQWGVWGGDLKGGVFTWCTILLNASWSLPWMVANFLASLLASWIGMSTLYTSFTASYMPAWKGDPVKTVNPVPQIVPVRHLRVQFHLSSILTMEKEAAACSRSPTRPISVKYFPEHMPSSSGDTTSSETADSSSTLEEIFCAHPGSMNGWHFFIQICASSSLLTWKVTQPTGRYLRSSSMLRYSATRAALWTRHWAASAWLFLSECFPAMFWSHVRRRSGDVW